MIKLDYTLESPEERKALVEKIIEETENITPQYMEILADYLVLCMEKQEKKQKKILTDNRMATVNKRETSFEGIVGQLENGEDGIYNMIVENDKNVILVPKISITEEDLATIPLLKQLRQAIIKFENALKKSSGRQAYILKKALIEMRREQYLIKQAYQKPITFHKLTRGQRSYLPLDDNSYIDEDNIVHIEGISLMDPKVVTAILCNYSRLKQDSYDQFTGDMWYLLLAFDKVSEQALRPYPIYEKIVEMKIDGKQNNDIQLELQKEFGMSYTVEYTSSLWRNKIPKLIATAAVEEFITWHFTYYGLPFKKCTRCGQEKPAHNQFFSKNNTSKDHFYSICKVCRNQKQRKCNK